MGPSGWNGGSCHGRSLEHVRANSFVTRARLSVMVDTSLYVMLRIVHLLVAGVWAGWTVFMAALVVPAARDGRLGADALGWVTGRFARFSQVAPVVMLLTGGYMIGQGFSGVSLLESFRGTLVLAMVVLWLVLSALTNVSSRRLVGSVESAGAGRAASDTSMLFSLAAVVALALLLVGGWL